VDVHLGSAPRLIVRGSDPEDDFLDEQRDMPRKPNMTVTSRFVDELPPLAVRGIPTPRFEVPPHRAAIPRLGFRGPSPKIDWSAKDLAHAIGTAALPDALLFLDTNVFTTEMDQMVWDAIYSKRILITPRVWKEILPWLKTPFHNKATRDYIYNAVQKQLDWHNLAQREPAPEEAEKEFRNAQVLFEDETFTNHAYGYYLRLLALRKAIGPMATSILTSRLGRAPTNDELLAEVQSQFGIRGFHMARKGVEAVNSPNVLTDEQFVLMAIITAITRGQETFIITRDTDVLEQYYKALNLMKEHYRAMCVGECHAANPHAIPFQKMSVIDDGVHIPEFEGDSVLQLETTDLEFNPRPTAFHFVNVYCLVLGGGPSNFKVSYCCFCAEKEMAQMLKIKTETGGLSTDKLDGRNCTIRTAPLSPENHRVVVSLGKERIVEFGGGKFAVNDLNNALYENEQKTSIFYRS
jgi:hypothetical protein